MEELVLKITSKDQMGSLSAVLGDTQTPDSLVVAALALVLQQVVLQIIILTIKERILNTTMPCLPFNSKEQTQLNTTTT